MELWGAQLESERQGAIHGTVVGLKEPMEVEMGATLYRTHTRKRAERPGL